MWYYLQYVVCDGRVEGLGLAVVPFIGLVPVQPDELAPGLGEPVYLRHILVKVDVDEAQDIASNCGISAMPTFQLYKNGKKVGEVCGASEGKIRDIINKHL